MRLENKVNGDSDSGDNTCDYGILTRWPIQSFIPGGTAARKVHVGFILSKRVGQVVQASND